MKKISALLLCIAIVFSFAACKDNNEFSVSANDTVVSDDGTEYTKVGFEGKFVTFGEVDFIGHISGEKKSFVHLSEKIKTGMYSVDGKRDVLLRFFPDNEFACIYVKSNLLNTETNLENCIRLEFSKAHSIGSDILSSKKGITRCKEFLDEIKSGQTAKEAGLYDLVKQADGRLENCYLYGYVYGFLQEDINLAIPMAVTSFDDKAYSIKLDDIEYVLTKEWIDKLLN